MITAFSIETFENCYNAHDLLAGPGGMDMASMMAGMGGDKPDMDDLDGDSDDEDLPDLE